MGGVSWEAPSISFLVFRWRVMFDASPRQTRKLRKALVGHFHAQAIAVPLRTVRDSSYGARGDPTRRPQRGVCVQEVCSRCSSRRVRLNPDRRLAGPPQVVSTGNSPRYQAAAQAAIRAVLQGQPYTMLRTETYDQWKFMDIDFDPKTMFRS